MVDTLENDVNKWANAVCQINPELSNVDRSIVTMWAKLFAADPRTPCVHDGDHVQYLIDNGVDPFKQKH